MIEAGIQDGDIVVIERRNAGPTMATSWSR